MEKSSPFVLSRFEMPNAPELMVHSCEDCACPVLSNEADCHSPGAGQFDSIDDASKWIRAREIVEMRIDQEHQALFNPLGRSGVVVVNRAAHQIYDSFRHPATFKDARIAGQAMAMTRTRHRSA